MTLRLGEDTLLRTVVAGERRVHRVYLGGTRVLGQEAPPGPFSLRTTALAHVVVRAGGSYSFKVWLSRAPRNPAVLTAQVDGEGGSHVTASGGGTVQPDDFADQRTFTVTVADTVPAGVSQRAVITVSGGPEALNQIVIAMDVRGGTVAPHLLVEPRAVRMHPGDVYVLQVRVSPGDTNADINVAITGSDNDKVRHSPSSLVFSSPFTATSAPQVVSLVAEDVTTETRGTTTFTPDNSTPAVAVATTVEPDLELVLGGLTKGRLSILEGRTGQFTVRLSHTPRSPVVLTVEAFDATFRGASAAERLSASPDSLSLSVLEATVDQVITVTAPQDTNAQDEVATVHVTLSGEGESELRNVIPIDILDNDVRPYLTTDTRAVDIFENETQAIRVALSERPFADATVSVTLSDAAIGTVAPTRLIFTRANWGTAQSLTLTPKVITDNSESSRVAELSLLGMGGGVSETVAIPVRVRNVVVASNALVLSASQLKLNLSRSGTFKVKLSRQPTSDVRVALTSSETAITLSAATLVFDVNNWDTQQEVTVSASGSTDLTGTITATPSGGSSDGVAKTVAVSATSAAVVDIVVSSDQLALIKGAPRTTIQVSLSRAPPANVVLSAVSSDAARLRVSIDTPTLTFTPQSWSTPQDVHLQAPGTNDDQDHTASLVLTATSGEAGNSPLSIPVSLSRFPTNPLQFTLAGTSFQLNFKLTTVTPLRSWSRLWLYVTVRGEVRDLRITLSIASITSSVALVSSPDNWGASDVLDLPREATSIRVDRPDGDPIYTSLMALDGPVAARLAVGDVMIARLRISGAGVDYDRLYKVVAVAEGPPE